MRYRTNEMIGLKIVNITNIDEIVINTGLSMSSKIMASIIF